MKLFTIVALSLALGGAPALADPNPSQNPRVGQLAELSFDLGSAELRRDDRSKQDLGRIAAWARDNPDGLVVLDGHADKRGSSPHNVRLSLKRALTVRDQLVELGVDVHQIVIAAYGEQGPRNRGNRRVVVWGTRSGMEAVVARSVARGQAEVLTSLTPPPQPRPSPGAVANR